MAKFNPTIEGSVLFGKSGGQNISITRNGSVIRNTSQPPKTATVKQARQRFHTSYLANQYLLLDNIERSKWHTEKPNYQYINSAGLTVERTALGVFYFLNQNLIIIDNPMLKQPPIYEAVTPADITILASGQNALIIQDTNVNLNYTYVVYTEVHNSPGQASLTPEPLITQLLEPNELKLGIDILPEIVSTFNLVPGPYNITFQVIAIINNNGNRDLNPATYNANVNTKGLGLSILSYYPWSADANDYFGVNNPTYVGATRTNTGIVDGAMSFSGADASYLNLGNNGTFQFDVGGVVQPFAFCFWVNCPNTNNQFWAGIRQKQVKQTLAGYQMVMTSQHASAQAWDGAPANNIRYKDANSVITNNWVFCAYSYNIDGTIDSYYNSVQLVLDNLSGTYPPMTALNEDMVIGRYFPNSSFNMFGLMSELTFFNQSLDFATFEIIKAANLSGQTILDIN